MGVGRYLCHVTPALCCRNINTSIKVSLLQCTHESIKMIAYSLEYICNRVSSVVLVRPVVNYKGSLI